MNSSARCCLVAFLLATTLQLAAPCSRAWGCKGHQTVAVIAEKYLSPQAREFVDRLLRENPIDPGLRRSCGSAGRDLLADGSTWPDDVRNDLRNGSWHYIDIPRGAPRGPLDPYCGASCLTKTIQEQFALLKNPRADATLRADALRYLIHFIGDLHTPLHASTNNDMGGNCVPLRYFRRRPHEHNNAFTPNLHAVWDTAIVERDSKGADPAAYADRLDQAFHAEADRWQHAGIHIDAWAWESHDLAESVVYRELTPKIPIEPPTAVHSCSDDDGIGGRLMQMHLAVARSYQEVAAPVVQRRLAQAGVRLAMLLNEAAASQAPRN